MVDSIAAIGMYGWEGLILIRQRKNFIYTFNERDDPEDDDARCGRGVPRYRRHFRNAGVGKKETGGGHRVGKYDNKWEVRGHR